MKSGKSIDKKCLPEYFKAVKNREKTFEIRKDDSDYQVGDILRLREWNGEKYTGNEVIRQITYIIRDCPEYGLMPGYCILAIQSASWDMFKDGPKAVLDEEDPDNWPEAEVFPEGGGSTWWYVCDECHGTVNPGQKVCLQCKRRLNWKGTAYGRV